MEWSNVLQRTMIASIAGLLVSSPCFADGFYAGVGFASTQIEDDDGDFGFDDSPLGWRLFGGYAFNEHFALEGAYFDVGDIDDTILRPSTDGGINADVDAEHTGVTFSAVGILPITDSASLLGKLGYYDSEQESTVLDETLDTDEDGVTLGIGIRFDLPRRFAIRGDLDWFDTDLDTHWSVGTSLQYRFGR